LSRPEEEWLHEAYQGDEQAFTYLVETYQNQVFNLCYRMLGDPYEAEDAAQETFLRAYRAIRRYDPKRPFNNWVLTIASRYCIDQLRRRRLIFYSIDDFLERGLPDPSIGPEGALSQRERQLQLQAILHTLKPIDRAAVVMHYWYDFSYEEIAESLSLSVSAVKSRLHRARKELALRWQEKDQKKITTKRERHGSPVF
jgi:RNA polymerase sigma-70 factor (ECF subfamily)